MNKNIIIILLIFLIPVCLYWGLTKDKTFVSLPSDASHSAVIIKFSSPMCYDCQNLEKTFDEIYPAFSDKIQLRKIDVTQNDLNTKEMVKEYQVKLVPTTIFKDINGKSIRRVEGSIQPKLLESYIKEAING